MKKVEKEYRKYIESKLPVPNIKDRIKSHIEFKKKEGLLSMLKKKWIVGLSSCAALVLVGGIVLSTAMFNLNAPSQKKAKAIVNVDVNPSVELVVDDRDRVVSVKGLNDEGSMIIYGEALVGKDVNNAISTIIKVETETGYLVANADVSQNTIKVSVSADDEKYKDALESKIEVSIDDTCLKNHVKASVEYVEKYTHAQLVEIALKCDSSLNKEDADKMSYKELAKIIALYHIETSDLYEEKLEEFYVQVRDDDIALAKYEPVQKAIEGADSVMKAVLNLYSKGISELESYYLGLEDVTYTTFVDPNSSYQLALQEVYNAKKDVLAYRNQLANVDYANETLYKSLMKSLDLAESILDSKESALKAYEEIGTTTIETYRGTLLTAINALKSLEAVFPSDVKTYLDSKVQNTDKELNKAKKEAFQEFEKAHKEDIQKAKKQCAERKLELKNQIKAA